MPVNVLYTDLSRYYDLMCEDIDYQSQSHAIHRMHQIFGNGGKLHLDLACGTGPHVRYFLDNGYQSSGLDINQPMLELAKKRCPEAKFIKQDMSNFTAETLVDLITCFLYSIHYNSGIDKLMECIHSAHQALQAGGVFCFNVVDKSKIKRDSFVRHSVNREGAGFTFQSGWRYSGSGQKQFLDLQIEKTTENGSQNWKESHPMVAFSFLELKELLEDRFDVHMFEHDYQKIIPWDEQSGNAIFVCVKK
ncbi:class I SAM-dependent methyltransferase [Vibrio sp. 99-70-13A1]|uniref:class I SAM-dependent DNA methyltransferase n=1 Tax=Vibrio sp. 99-70-13A1 TaxID=2607601 RepID=UPI00149342AD|nr:class I SAM-dependent methyltransferase [Vibrio sp. 99-70-13A1]NOH98709.1 class I SAM-dependent methyltransferase [Vibrio sp. 99-70-13A1]